MVGRMHLGNIGMILRCWIAWVASRCRVGRKQASRYEHKLCCDGVMNAVQFVVPCWSGPTPVELLEMCSHTGNDLHRDSK